MAKTPKTTEPEAPVVALPSAAEARTELGRALRIFQAFQAADRVLAVLENAEQTTTERNKAADEATQRLAAIKAEVTAAEESRDQARQEARDIRAGAKAEADRMLDEARASNVQTLRAATERLAEIEADVRAKTEDRNALAKELAELSAQVVDARGLIERAQAARAALAQL